VTLDNSGLVTGDRSVNNLGPRFDAPTKVISFGAWSMGDDDGVSGDIEVMTFETEDLLSQLTIIEKTFTDKDATAITGTVSIESND